MQRALALMVVLIPAAAAAGPVMIDADRRGDTVIHAVKVDKDGFPWGWTPQPSVVYVKIDKAEGDDVLIVQHLQGAKKWGPEQKCKLERFDGIDHLARFECKQLDQALAITTGGRFSAELSYKHVADDKTDAGIGTLKYSVLKYDCDDRHIKKRYAPSPCFVVDHDFRIGEAWLHETYQRDGYLNDSVDKTAPTNVTLTTWIKYAGQDEPNDMVVRCTSKGKEIAKSGGGPDSGEISYEAMAKEHKSEPRLTWRRYSFALGVTGHTPTKPTERYALDKNPGDYQCAVTAGGDRVLELAFTINPDGNVTSACQSPSVSTLPTTHPIKVTYKAGFNARYDATAFQKGPLYGKPAVKGCTP